MSEGERGVVIIDEANQTVGSAIDRLAEPHANEGLIRRQQQEIQERRRRLATLGKYEAAAIVALLIIGGWSAWSAHDARDREAAAMTSERRLHADLADARARIFGAHFLPTEKGWFIEFPPCTKIKQGSDASALTVQVFPNEDPRTHRCVR